ncbi:hypothetical protein Hypma_004891 [Hypsizygus marmoreus]|uniref:F-box domain-containing protein n=1 Tax=Hypsizygus marmoreus TaxID=39966 RepID=A0A369KGN6_HYPMA|nr:hypothetical protein Hypma_004891 [Hypsizygus marmoreus]
MDTLDESRYFHLLTTNHEPSDTEVLELRKIIAQREVFLAHLDARITELQHIPYFLIERRTLEHQLLTLYRGIISPIRRLPHDVLIEIFLHTRNWKPDTFRMRDMEAIPVALSTPLLWSSIRSCYNDPAHLGFSALYDERLPAWSARTGTYSPLDATFEGPNIRTSLAQSLAAPLSRIAPLVHRVRTLSLRGVIDCLPNGSYDALEMLRVADVRFDYSTGTSISTPSLRRIGFYRELIHFAFIPWRRLTHIYINVGLLVPSVFLRIVRQSTALVRLDVTCLMMKPDPDMEWNRAVMDTERFGLPYLEMLCLGNDELIYCLLPHLILPVLTHLRLTCYSAPMYYALQSRWSFELRSFAFRNGRMEESELLDLLLRTPSLTDVR